MLQLARGKMNHLDALLQKFHLSFSGTYVCFIQKKKGIKKDIFYGSLDSVFSLLGGH